MFVAETPSENTQRNTLEAPKHKTYSGVDTENV